jgi:hypothetical protein
MTSSTSKWQRQFLKELFQALFALRGRANFTNLARFSPISEQTFRRNFNKPFDWVRFNWVLISIVFTGEENSFIVAADCTFLPKNGSQTYGLDRFWSGTANRTQRGLEASVVALVHTDSGRAFTLGADQTPPSLSEETGGGEGSRMSFYTRQLSDYLKRLPDNKIHYVVADGYYGKTCAFESTEQAGCHLITKLRRDANLRYLYEGPQKSGRGAPRRYDGKVDFTNLERFEHVGHLEDASHVAVYTKQLNSPHFQRNLRVVVLANKKTESYVVLASSDPTLDAMKLVKYYRLRFQIELLFRDGKQFTGLTHCQARSKQKLHFHLNMSLTAVNLARVSIERSKKAISISTFIRRAYNRWLITRFLSKLSLKAQIGLKHPKVQQVIRMGSMS